MIINLLWRDIDRLWVKASGVSLATISESGFALQSCETNLITEKVYSSNADEREEQVKRDLEEATLTKGKRPSVETSMHNAINYAFVVHLHPTLVNGLMCSQNAESELIKLFGDTHLFVEYTDPGYILFKKVNDKIEEYRKTYNDKEPKVIWLQNHGVFVAANTIEEIQLIYNEIIYKLEGRLIEPLDVKSLEVNSCVTEILPALRMLLSDKELKTLRVRNNGLIKYYSEQPENQKDIVRPFTPDAIVYCKSNYIFLNSDNDLLEEAEQKISDFTEEFGYLPKVILIRGIGLVAVGDNANQCDIILDVFEDAMRIAFLSKSFGGHIL